MINYSVKTDVGTFTRKSKSDRKYTHIVVSKRSEKRVAEMRSYFQKFVNSYLANPSEYPTGYYERRAEEYKQFEENIDAYLVEGFCGRLELARGVASKAQQSSYQTDVRIYTITGERI